MKRILPLIGISGGIFAVLAAFLLLAGSSALAAAPSAPVYVDPQTHTAFPAARQTSTVAVEAVIAGTPDHFDLEIFDLNGNPVGTATAGEMVNLAVTVKDHNGVPVPYTGAATLSSPGSLFPFGGVDTDGDGWADQADVQFAGQSRRDQAFQVVRAGQGSVLATAPAATPSFGFVEFQVQAGSPAIATLSPVEVQVAVANPAGRAVVKLTDNFGNKVLQSDIPVQITPMSGETVTSLVTVNGKTGAQTWITDGTGAVVLNYSLPPLVGAAYDLVLSFAPGDDPGTTQGDSLRITVVNTLPASVGVSLRNVDRMPVNTVAAGEPVWIWANLKDAGGNGIPYQESGMSLQLDPAVWQLPQQTPTDLGGGTYEFLAVPERAGQQTVGVQYRNGDTVISGSARLAVAPSPAWFATVSEALPGNAFCVPEGVSVPVTVRLTDTFLNPTTSSTQHTVTLESDSPDLYFRNSATGENISSVSLMPGQTEARIYIMAQSSANGASILLQDQATGTTWTMQLGVGACGQVRAPVAPTATELVDVPVEVTGAGAVGAFSFEVWYDPHRLAVDHVGQAAYPGGAPAPYLSYAQVSPGHVRVAGRAGSGAGGSLPPDDLFLSVISFRPLKWGASMINLGQLGLWDLDNLPVPTGLQSATLKVTPWVGGLVLLEGGAVRPVNVGTAGTVLTTTTTAGRYRLEVPDVGWQQLLFQADGYLRGAQAVTVGDGPADAPTITLTAGDLNGDDTVDGQDLALAAAAWRSGGVADFSASGAVDLADLFLIGRNQGSNADPEVVPPVEPVVFVAGEEVLDPGTVLRLEGGHSFVTMVLIDEVYGPPATWDPTSRTAQFTWGGNTYTITDGVLSKNGVDQGVTIAHDIIDGQGWFAIDQFAPLLGMPMRGGPLTNVWWFGN